ncbi:MAG: hypothetical protein H0T79_10370, partial [Deltaproteobacteria bacterium]|nr:hypothetical protein [Deltaproteobacteria bacterium]
AMPDANVLVDAASSDAALRDAAPARDAAVIAPKPDAGRVIPLAPVTEDPEARQALVEAEQALAAQDYPRAEGQANKVINSEKRSPPQKAQALSIRGIVQCLHYRSEERARYDLRALPRGAYRTRLLKACKATGQLSDD